jgi:hypothetical protein
MPVAFGNGSVETDVHELVETAGTEDIVKLVLFYQDNVLQSRGVLGVLENPYKALEAGGVAVCEVAEVEDKVRHPRLEESEHFQVELLGVAVSQFAFECEDAPVAGISPSEKELADTSAGIALERNDVFLAVRHMKNLHSMEWMITEYYRAGGSKSYLPELIL